MTKETLILKAQAGKTSITMKATINEETGYRRMEVIKNGKRYILEGNVKNTKLKNER